MADMTAREIALTVENAVLTSQQTLRDEHQKGIAAVHTEVGAVKEDVASVKRQVEVLQSDVALLKAGQGDAMGILNKMSASLAELKSQLSEISTETHEVKTETADGVTMVKKVKMYATVFGDLKKPITWLWLAATTVGYNFAKAWFVAHGITFSVLFAHK